MQGELASLDGRPIKPQYQDPYNLFSDTLATTVSSIHLSPYAAPDASGVQITDMIVASIFHATTEETNSPALALQAIKTVLKRMIYYDFISSFPPRGLATITRFTTTPIPQSMRGYWIVVATVVLHILLFGVLSLLFLRTKYSVLNNSWHTVAQVAESAELKELLAHSKLASDDQVDHWINGTEAPRNAFETAKHALRKVPGLFPGSQHEASEDRYVIDAGVFLRAPGSDALTGEPRHRPGYTPVGTHDGSWQGLMRKIQSPGNAGLSC